LALGLRVSAWSVGELEAFTTLACTAVFVAATAPKNAPVDRVLTIPIFDVGRNWAAVQGQEAVAREVLAGYEKTIQTAFREVADALINLQQTGAAESDYRARVAATRNALRLANRRYESGFSPYLDVLDAQRSLNEAELAQIINRQAQLAASVDLMKALGGGWSPEPVLSKYSVENAQAATQ
jgi:outer membrane protein TolC